jgi:hypothetical protein
MESERLNLIISPEVLRGDLFTLNYDGTSFGLYSGMSQVLSSGENGSSILTGLTIPILFTETFNDLGFYDEFDGLIDQQDTINNFFISGNSVSPYEVVLYNSAGFTTNNYLALSNYNVEWGDGSSASTVNVKQNTQVHYYSPTPQTYTIKMTQNNIWGTTEIIKQVTVPFTGVTVDNILGNVTFTQQGGKWSGIPLNYNYIFTGDSNNNVSSHYSSNYTQVPFIVSGFTNSKLNSLRRWGPNPFTVGYVMNVGKNNIGYVEEITTDYTAYTINDVSYLDFNNKKTIFYVNSSGFTSIDLIASGLTKNELLLDFVFDPEIRSDVYVERGKYSGFEQLQRLGEVDNIGDLIRYGYGFFKIKTT